MVGHQWQVDKAAEPRVDDDVAPISTSSTGRGRFPAMDATYLGAIVNCCNDAIIGQTLDGIVVSWNPAAQRIFGFAAAEIIGRSVTLIIPPERGDEETRLMSQIRQGQTIEHFETVRRRKDGQEIDVGYTVSPICDESGSIVGASKIACEITERRRSEQQLARAVQRYLNAAGVLVVVLNADATVRMINPRGCNILGYDSPSEIIGKSWIDTFVPARLRKKVGEAFGRLVSGRDGESAFDTNIVVTKTGEERVIAGYHSILTDGDGRVVASISAGNDITDRKRSEEALKKSEQKLLQAQKMEAIGTLTGGMAHDFNNLLGVIILNLDLLTTLINVDEESSEALSAALDAALSGADLTRRLLAFARRQPLRPHRFDPNQLITTLFELLRRTLGEAIVVSIKLAPDTWPVVADPVQLESSLTNLATNARDAMPNGGKLTVTTANCELDADYAALHGDLHPGAYVMIEITDTGTGISREVLEHIFEPFFTTKEEGKGSGLGLSMVFGFAKQSGGHLTVSSEPGIGTTFRLYLPRAMTETLQAKAEPGGAVPVGAGEGILVVEDNAALRRIVARQLVKLGYRVFEADSAAAAIAKVGTEHIDLLLTDVVMPGQIDGYRLASQVLAQSPQTKVVLTSGFPDLKSRADVADASRLRLLSKPYRQEELARCVREVLDS